MPFIDVDAVDNPDYLFHILLFPLNNTCPVVYVIFSYRIYYIIILHEMSITFFFFILIGKLYFSSLVSFDFYCSQNLEFIYMTNCTTAWKNIVWSIVFSFIVLLCLLNYYISPLNDRSV